MVFFFFCKATIATDEYHFDNHEIGDLGVSSLRFVCLFVSLLGSELSLQRVCFSSINSLFSSTVQAPFSTSNYTVPLTSIQCLSPRDVPPQNKRSHNTCNLV